MNIDAGNPAFWAAVLALLTGILILIFPRVLNYIVAIYLIIIGILGLLPFFGVATAAAWAPSRRRP